MSAKSKWFRVAIEGATTDGRKIEAKWLTEIARTYSAAKYGARIFIEHIRGINPDYGFAAQGDVLAVKTEEFELASGDKRLALYAQIQPTDAMVELLKKKQKIYSSIEVNPNFADSGEAYLVGLGITDSPASLGTEVLEFAAQHPDANPFTTRKQHPGNLFSAAMEADIELESEEAPGLLSRVAAMFRKSDAGTDRRFADVHSAVEEVASHVATTTEGFSTRIDALEASTPPDIAALTQRITDLETSFASTAVGTPRALATGVSAPGEELTDC